MAVHRAVVTTENVRGLPMNGGATVRVGGRAPPVTLPWKHSVLTSKTMMMVCGTLVSNKFSYKHIVINRVYSGSSGRLLVQRWKLLVDCGF